MTASSPPIRPSPSSQADWTVENRGKGNGDVESKSPVLETHVRDLFNTCLEYLNSCLYDIFTSQLLPAFGLLTQPGLLAPSPVGKASR